MVQGLGSKSYELKKDNMVQGLGSKSDELKKDKYYNLLHDFPWRHIVTPCLDVGVGHPILANHDLKGCAS